MSAAPKLHKRVLIISTWAPPMVGAPQSLYNILSRLEGEFAVLVSRDAMLRSLRRSRRRGSALSCRYYAVEGGAIEAPDALAALPAPNDQPGADQLVEERGIPGLRQCVSVASLIRTMARYLRRGRQVIATEKSELLLGISDEGTALISTWLLSLLTRKPYLLYLFDLYRGNKLDMRFRLLARVLERPVLTRARRVIVTNEATEQYYQRRYGNLIRTGVVPNCSAARPVEAEYAPRPPFTIVFTGNVYWAQLHSLLNLVKAMDLLADLPLTLQLYVPGADPALVRAVKGRPRITLGAAPQAEMPKIQGQATLLFLPLAWHTPSPDIVATATPGKFTDYLASGRPMLIHAPDYAYVSQHARRHQLGLVVDQDSPDLLATAIRDYLAHPEQGRKYVTNALARFRQDHDVEQNARLLAEILNQAQN